MSDDEDDIYRTRSHERALEEPMRRAQREQRDRGKREAKAILRYFIGTDPIEKPLPCRCGRTPEVVIVSAGPDLIVAHLECRRWWGLWLCARGPDTHDDHDSPDYAEKIATFKWNDMRRRQDATKP